ncbi:MAG: pirin family protein, partial [Pseudomonadota bacterium]
DEDPVHFLQIWILPEKNGLEPSYEQKAFTAEDKRGQLRLVGSRDGRDGTVTIHQDVDLYASLLDDGESVSHSFAEGRYGWLQVARGSVRLDGNVLTAGDGVALKDASQITIDGVDDAEILLFDMVA